MDCIVLGVANSRIRLRNFHFHFVVIPCLLSNTLITHSSRSSSNVIFLSLPGAAACIGFLCPWFSTIKKGATEEEMVAWHHRLNGHEFEQTLGDSEGQGSLVSESCSVVSYSLQPQGLYSPWNSPDQNTGVGRLSLLQGIVPTQG